jgi:hypothetical protein
VIAVEAKFSEHGFSPCRCHHRDEGMCSARILERPYWSVAGRDLGLRHTPPQCSLSVAYQPVRNIAAAQAVAGPTRGSAFVLLYDQRNPYFSGAGRWPGWVSVLERLTQHATTRFAAMSWQALVTCGIFQPEIVRWAHDKHGLAPSTST